MSGKLLNAPRIIFTLYCVVGWFARWVFWYRIKYMLIVGYLIPNRVSTCLYKKNSCTNKSLETYWMHLVTIGRFVTWNPNCLQINWLLFTRTHIGLKKEKTRKKTLITLNYHTSTDMPSNKPTHPLTMHS